MGNHQEDAKVFKALCDPKRLAILEQLRSGEKCACVLQEPMDLTQSGLSYHMKILCDSGIVVSRQEGKWTHYSISPEGREKAVLAGANVVMPNITPHRERENYSLYDGKACSGAESLDGIGLLESRLKGIGYEISWKIGDYGDFDR